MIAKFIAASAFAASLIAVSASAQAAAELLQKGIHAEETDGDADGAIRIYRQVIASPDTTRTLAAQAEMQIVHALLQKGDLSGAGQEFGRAARDFADQEELVTSTAQRLRATAANGPTPLLGDFHDGKYHHYWTGVELTLPPNWSFKTQRPDEGLWDRADFGDPNSATVSAFVVMQPDTTQPEHIGDRLLERYEYKIAVQRRASVGYSGFHVRPEGVQHSTVGGRQALSAIADYTNAQGDKMSEYLVVVQSEKTAVFFSVSSAAPDFTSVQSQFQSVLLTAQVP